MADIRKQFSLDWLAGDPQTRGSQERSSTPLSSSGPSALDEAVVFYSQQIMQKLDAAEGHEMRLHKLVPAVNEEVPVNSFEEFAGVIKYLADLGIIGIVEKEVTGNDLVRLLKKR